MADFEVEMIDGQFELKHHGKPHWLPGKRGDQARASSAGGAGGDKPTYRPTMPGAGFARALEQSGLSRRFAEAEPAAVTSSFQRNAKMATGRKWNKAKGDKEPGELSASYISSAKASDLSNTKHVLGRMGFQEADSQGNFNSYEGVRIEYTHPNGKVAASVHGYSIPKQPGAKRRYADESQIFVTFKTTGG